MTHNNNHRFLTLSLLLLIGYLLAQIGTGSINAQRDAHPTQGDSVLVFLPVVQGRQKIASAPIPDPNCRYGTYAKEEGFGVLPTLGAGWVYKQHHPTYATKPANGAEMAHVIKTKQVKTAEGVYLPDYYTSVPLDNTLADYISLIPGALWIIGSEVDRGPQPGEIVSPQGDMHPEIYAESFHDVQAFIKANDPTARIANAGLVEVTPGRLQYLDKVWETYQNNYGGPMPVDVWNMHIYILPEVNPIGLPNGIANVAVGTDPALGKKESGGDPTTCSDPDVYCFAEHDDINVFAEQVEDMRQWMKDHGQQQKPLILSEYSILYPYIDDGDSCYIQDEYGNCFTQERIVDFMDATFDYLESAKSSNLGYAIDNNRLVQQWNWFAVFEYGAGEVSNLTYGDYKTLTLLGENYRDYVTNKPRTVNLLIDNVPNSLAKIGPDGTADVQISVVYRNNGTTTINSPYEVTFYKDAARTQVIDSIMVASDLRGCATNVHVASVNWSGLGIGQHQFWVYIDSDNVIVETPPNQDDNVAAGIVQVNP